MRKMKESLMERLTNGELSNLLNYIKKDHQLRLEVRTKDEAFVYYRKGKALEIGKFKVDRKYGNVSDTKLAASNPEEYFKKIKEAIDTYTYDKLIPLQNYRRQNRKKYSSGLTTFIASILQSVMRLKSSLYIFWAKARKTDRFQVNYPEIFHNRKAKEPSSAGQTLECGLIIRFFDNRLSLS